ncbi:MAG: mannitol dehydrogenase family protein [Pseudoalteromonas sp.]|uniref:mannitol dehydrogenase family protein n=2 Tax=Pseudoalteromonas TaxID=53246 RepID=UPI003F9935A1
MTQLQHTHSQAQVVELNQESIATLPSSVDVPTYDRSKVKAGIVHIGVGGFHRAHQATYINELLKTPGNEQWGICGVGLLEANRDLRDILHKQDNLYTLTVRHPNGSVNNTVIGSMVEFLFAPENKQAVINKMAHSDTKIVSLTITEGGYNFHPATGEFDYTNPDIIHDIANPEQPITAFGYITAALKLRKEQNLAAFTVQSCDNIQHNGHVTRKMLLAFAQKQDAELAQWIEQHVAFPNAMVDRITPISKQSDIDYVTQAYGINDGWPITCESFTQWVIEDDFSDGRPNWDNVGAQFVSDVTPFEKMKIRLLNAGHSVLGLLGSIHGYSTIDETVSDPLFAKYLRAFMDLEVTPLLETLPGIELDNYKDILIERFSNPNIKDNLARICSESSAKLPKFLIASISENLAQNRNVSLAALVIASWCLYSDKGMTEQGQALDIQDAMAKELNQAAKLTATEPLSFIEVESIFGDLAKNKEFVLEYTSAIAALYTPNSQIKSVMNATLAAKEGM